MGWNHQLDYGKPCEIDGQPQPGLTETPQLRFWPWMTCKRSCGALFRLVTTGLRKGWERLVGDVLSCLVGCLVIQVISHPLSQKFGDVWNWWVHLPATWKLLGWRNDRIHGIHSFFQDISNRFSDFFFDFSFGVLPLRWCWNKESFGDANVEAIFCFGFGVCFLAEDIWGLKHWNWSDATLIIHDCMWQHVIYIYMHIVPLWYMMDICIQIYKRGEI